jgi:hypothetical protein
MTLHLIERLHCTHVDGAALAVQSPHHVAGANRLATTQFHDSADVLSISKRYNLANDSIILLGTVIHTYAHDFLEETLELGACLFVDRGRDALDAAAARHATNVSLADAVDIVPQDLSMRRSVCYYRRVARTRKTILPVPLRARLAQAKTFSSNATPTYTSD